MLQGGLLTRGQSQEALLPSVTGTLIVFVSSGGTGMFSHLMTNKVILYGRHCDGCSGMRVVDMMPETLEIGATKSNMDGPHLWSQGSASQTYSFMTGLSKADCGSTSKCSCERRQEQGAMESSRHSQRLEQRFARPVVTYGITNMAHSDRRPKSECTSVGTVSGHCDYDVDG